MADREQRLQEEFELIASVFSDVIRSGDWFLIANDTRAVRHGWSPDPFAVAFHAQKEHPGQVPYGIYVPSASLVNGQVPTNFSAKASNRPPFDGEWGVLSWQGDADKRAWFPKTNIREGDNLLNFMLTFGERFKQGA